MEITTEMIRRWGLPPIYGTQAEKNPRILVKFVSADGRVSWYVAEAGRSGDDWIFFGYTSFPTTWTYFTGLELRGLGAEQDESFIPCTLADLLRASLVTQGLKDLGNRG